MCVRLPSLFFFFCLSLLPNFSPLLICYFHFVTHHNSLTLSPTPTHRHFLPHPHSYPRLPTLVFADGPLVYHGVNISELTSLSQIDVSRSLFPRGTDTRQTRVEAKRKFSLRCCVLRLLCRVKFTMNYSASPTKGGCAGGLETRHGKFGEPGSKTQSGFLHSHTR